MGATPDRPTATVSKLVRRTQRIKLELCGPIAPRTFEYRGASYRYLDHPYNGTRYNERRAELPIFAALLDAHDPGEVLELGNVTGHYRPRTHDVVDKYERGEDVVNSDIVDFETDKRYSLIVAISTLEHVGWDEEVRDPQKVDRAVAALRRLLAPGGQLVCSIPLGYNQDLDALLERDMLGADEARFLLRTSAVNLWRETDWEHVRGARYDAPYPAANALVITYHGAADG